MSIVELTPMMRQYFEIKEQHPDEILFYRLGDFYEMFYEDAEIASRELDLVLTARNAGGGVKAPLCGVPYHSAQGYIGTLLQKGYSVAICEQTEDPKKAKNLVKRAVVKIITPGTLTDGELLDSTRNNYLLSLYASKKRIAISYVDLASFVIRTTTFEGSSALSDAMSEVRSLAPSEILLPEDMRVTVEAKHSPLSARYYEQNSVQTLLDQFINRRIQRKELSSEAMLSLGALLRYVQETQKLAVNTRFSLESYASDQYMLLDHTAITNLELFETLRSKEVQGSLFGVLDHTGSAMGQRLLRQWMLKPLRDVQAIEARLHWVALFHEEDMLRDRIREALGSLQDVERILGKLVFGNIQPRELRALQHALDKAPLLNELLKEHHYDRLPTFPHITEALQAFLAEELPATTKDGRFIRSGYHQELDELNDLLEHGSDRLLALEEKERSASHIKNLKIKYNRVFGYFFDVTNSYQHLVPDHFIRKQTLAGSERYYTEELKELESRILSADEQKLELEKQLYAEFVDRLKTEHEAMLDLTRALARLDVLTSLAYTAKVERYVRPRVHSGQELVIRQGRHPVIAHMLGREHFVPNDIDMNDTDHQFFIITGPNMAGKSTFLRQVALISLMAHMGSFVPASEALIPSFDRIFTRVGASDDLSQGQSTFMVEMSELSAILSQATNHSLVVLDEIGRGTSTYDGLSIAWSVVEYLTGELHPKTLFATHYHELTEIEERIQGVKNYRIAVQKIGDDIVLLRKIISGRAHQSFGIQVAKLAGLPDPLIRRASEILKELEAHDIARSDVSVPQHSELVKEILDIPIEEITPLEALNLLSNLIEKARHEKHR